MDPDPSQPVDASKPTAIDRCTFDKNAADAAVGLGFGAGRVRLSTCAPRNRGKDAPCAGRPRRGREGA